MEKTLSVLFDYQKFEGNPALECVIGRVHAGYTVRELDPADLDIVFAAGMPDSPVKKKADIK